MSRKKIKINIKPNEQHQPSVSKPEQKTTKSTQQKKEKPPVVQQTIPEEIKKLSTTEKIRQAKEARKRKEENKTKKKKKNGFDLLGKLLPLLFFLVLIYLGYYLLFGEFENNLEEPPKKETVIKEKEDAISVNKNNSNLRYGIDIEKYTYKQDVILESVPLSKFFERWLLPRGDIQKLISQASSVIRPAQTKEGQLYSSFFDQGSTRMPRFIVYEPDNYHYVVFTLLDSVGAKIVKRELKKERKSFSGTIQTDIYDLHQRKKLNYQLLQQMEEALAWSVDFHHIERGSRYKLYYDEFFADGEAVGAQIYALEFHTNKESVKAYYYDNGFDRGFFDGQARPMRRAFLKSPVKYARVSSPFNLARKHPILKKLKPHMGTDYAASKGTPIRAISDGVVTLAQFKKNNGNYVKIKHDKTYESQYLHMDSFMDGIKPGVTVKQGQTIGFVGSTGLATGPHVCFRFWKNGKQVNFQKEDLPDSRPLPRSQTSGFTAHRDSLKLKLDGIN